MAGRADIEIELCEGHVFSESHSRTVQSTIHVSCNVMPVFSERLSDLVIHSNRRCTDTCRVM